MTTFQHCSFIVPNLDGAVEFFRAYFDFQLLAQSGPIEAGGDTLNRIYGVPERATGHSAVLQNGPLKLVLFEWKTYGEAINPLRESTIPGCALALQVDDLEGMIGQLSGVRGLRFLETSPEGFVYCQTPSGIMLRLSGSTVFA
ncbi:MAG: VOC family protein [Saprospiraceae bacterium]